MNTPKQKPSLTTINAMLKGTIMEQLGIAITEWGEHYIVGTMPVDHRTHQPMGLLHGGASAVLIESLGSMGSALTVDIHTHHVVGIAINANHLRGVSSGRVTGKASSVHRGKKTHVWQADITDEQGHLVCTGRLTVMIVPKTA